jgi:ethanolamine utilization protein EutQ (cupin superfamily)
MADHKTTREVLLWTAEEVKAKYAGSGVSQLARVMTDENSDTIGFGLMNLKDGCAVDEMVKYDKAIYVTKGEWVISLEGKRAEGKAGDMLFIRRGTPVTYEARGDSEAVYCTYPVWWKAQQGNS